MPAPIRVLVVDDSAFARKVVREMLSSSPDLEVVGAARDGLEALELVDELHPDVITCDLKMPRLDGVGFVQQQMERQALPILILSSAAQDAADVMQALNAGAVDVIQKPSALATDELRVISKDLVDKVRAAGGIAPARLPRQVMAPAPLPSTAATGETPPAPVLPRLTSIAPVAADVVVIAISTGGPQGLRQLIPALPASFPVPIVIVLHMPVGYTALYAEKLAGLSALAVREAAEGDLVVRGQVLIAPAGRHVVLRRDAAGNVRVQLTMYPLTKLHRPSADVLFQSAAETYGERVLALVMTGMGDDGCEGAAWIKARGGTVFTEAEKSCVIYGMPRSVIEAGLSDATFPLEEIAPVLGECLV